MGPTPRRYQAMYFPARVIQTPPPVPPLTVSSSITWKITSLSELEGEQKKDGDWSKPYDVHWLSLMFHGFSVFCQFWMIFGQLRCESQDTIGFFDPVKSGDSRKIGDDQQNRKSMGAGDEKTKLVGLAHAFPGLTNTHLNLASKP